MIARVAHTFGKVFCWLLIVNYQLFCIFAVANDVFKTNIRRQLQEHTLTSVCL